MRLTYLLLLTLFVFSACQEAPPKQELPNSKAQKVNLSPSDLNLEKEGVKKAILDYVEGIYAVDSTRIIQSVHPELRKRGYWFSKKENAYRDNLDMTFDQLVSLAASWNKSGERANADSPKIIEIYDVNDRTASAKLTAEWGIDYFHLAKLDGKWMIMNVLWQSIKEDGSSEG